MPINIEWYEYQRVLNNQTPYGNCNIRVVCVFFGVIYTYGGIYIYIMVETVCHVIIRKPYLIELDNYHSVW